MAKKSEIYLGLSAQLQRILSKMAQRKAVLLEDIAKQQAALNTAQAKVNEELQSWDTMVKDASGKLEAIRNGPEEGPETERLRSEANTAISRLDASV